MSYLVKDGSLIAITSDALESGQIVLVSSAKTKNALNANRDYDLVGAIRVKVSNAKKWANKETIDTPWATRLNDGEYLISDNASD